MNRTTVIVSVLIGSFFIAGLIEPFTERPGEPYSAAGVVHMLLIAVLCYGWCKADAAERGIALPPGSAVLAGIVPPLGLPLYFFRSKPKRAALIASVRAVFGLVVMLALFVSGYAISRALRT